jgi:hypothetical protein
MAGGQVPPTGVRRYRQQNIPSRAWLSSGEPYALQGKKQIASGMARGQRNPRLG